MDFLPKDPAILVSSVNMLLRDEEFDTLESLCYAFSRDPKQIKRIPLQKRLCLELYEAIAEGRTDFLRSHKRFEEDITIVVERLEEML